MGDIVDYINERRLRITEKLLGKLPYDPTLPRIKIDKRDDITFFMSAHHLEPDSEKDVLLIGFCRQIETLGILSLNRKQWEELKAAGDKIMNSLRSNDEQ